MALAALLPVAAASQNRAIEALAEKYSGREGFTTTVLKGRITSDVSRTLDIRSVDISSIMKDISAIVVVSAEKPDAEFERDARAAAASTGYTTVLSQSSRGQQVSFLVSENGRGRRNEFVIIILGNDTNMLLSLVGDYKLTQIDKTE
jgi:hypothetical protein